MSDISKTTPEELDAEDEAILQVLGYHNPNGLTAMQISKEAPIYNFDDIVPEEVAKRLNRLMCKDFVKVKHGDNVWTLTKEGFTEALVCMV